MSTNLNRHFVAIRNETYERLAAKGQFGESTSYLISRLLDTVEQKESSCDGNLYTNSNGKMQIGTNIFKIINHHLDEVGGCRHNPTEILKQAFSLNYNKKGVHPTTSEHQSGIGTTDSNTSQGIDIDIGK